MLRVQPGAPTPNNPLAFDTRWGIARANDTGSLTGDRGPDPTCQEQIHLLKELGQFVERTQVMWSPFPLAQLTQILDTCELDRTAIVHQQAVDAGREMAAVTDDSECSLDEALAAFELGVVAAENDRSLVSGEA